MKKAKLNIGLIAFMLLFVFSCNKKSDSSSAPSKKPTIPTTSYNPGQSYKFKVSNGSSSVDAIEYIAGDKNSKLILTSPHGGSTQPSFLRTRTSDYNYGTLPNDPYNNSTGFVSGADGKTKELTLAIADTIFKKTGIRPHVIINLLHRSKLDANRRIEIAAQGDANAIKAWNAFMNYTEDAKAILLANNAAGLLIDVHGNGHTPQRTEVGYSISSTDFTTQKNNLESLTSKSSIKALVKAPVTMAELIKGDNALGTLLNIKTGEMVTPSKAYPEPANTAIFTDGEYFNGGYITSRFGSKTSGALSSTQLEFHANVRSNDSTRPKFAGKIADALIIYIDKYVN